MRNSNKQEKQKSNTTVVNMFWLTEYNNGNKSTFPNLETASKDYYEEQKYLAKKYPNDYKMPPPIDQWDFHTKLKAMFFAMPQSTKDMKNPPVLIKQIINN